MSFVAISLSVLSVHGECYTDPYTGQRYCTGSCPNCPSYGSARQSLPPTPPKPSNTVNVDSAAHCRIAVNDSTLGSGTLVARDQSIGLILTCAHLFDDPAQKIIVSFPNGGRFNATLIDIDHNQDLAALAIRRPEVEPLLVATGDPSGLLVACGFGPNGTFRGIQGNITGYATASGATYASTTIAGVVRPGDSGGGVLNSGGSVVGVVWGQRDGETYATCGRPVCDFLTRVRDKVFPKVVVAKKVPIANSTPTPPAPQSPASSSQSPTPSPQPDWQAFANELESRIRALDDKKQDKGDYLQPGDLNGYLRSDDVAKLTGPLAIKTDVENKIGELSAQFASVHTVVDSVKQHVEQLGADKDGILQGVSYGKVAVGALGLSGPLAAAVLAAAGFIGLRAKKHLAANAQTQSPSTATATSKSTRASTPVAVDSPPPPQKTVTETHYVPVEQDSFAKAHQWASEHVARKYPGAAELLQTQESLIKQFLAAQTSKSR
ncbi:MAG TPA: serine protease [Lacipirellulaceae bacterium]|nr:serine protease [Lacipirellulaceae bacterium]